MEATSQLTPAEIDVLVELVSGEPTGDREIAERRGVSINTIKTHMKHLFQKTGSDNRTQLAIWAIRRITELEEAHAAQTQ